MSSPILIKRSGKRICLSEELTLCPDINASRWRADRSLTRLCRATPQEKYYATSEFAFANDFFVSFLIVQKRINEKYRTLKNATFSPDWLLIYQIREDKLILTLQRTGSHNDLF